MRSLVVLILVLFVIQPGIAQTKKSEQEKSDTAKSAQAAKPSKQKEVFELNTATKAELESLKGIGPTHAEAIIKGRPYQRKDDLVRKKIISKEVYDGIKLKIFARRS